MLFQFEHILYASKYSKVYFFTFFIIFLKNKKEKKKKDVFSCHQKKIVRKRQSNKFSRI